MNRHLRNVRIRYGANLPHWTQEGAIYSVSFRLADSVPQETLARWRRERERLEQRSREGELTEHELNREVELHEERIEAFLDAGYGECLLRDPRAAELVAGALRHFIGTRYDLKAWCVMPNHAHAVVQPERGFELDSILHSWKSYTSTMVNRVLGRSGQLWQPESFDHLIREGRLAQKVEYVLRNPERAGLHDWPWVGRK